MLPAVVAADFCVTRPFVLLISFLFAGLFELLLAWSCLFVWTYYKYNLKMCSTTLVAPSATSFVEHIKSVNRRYILVLVHRFGLFVSPSCPALATYVHLQQAAALMAS